MEDAKILAHVDAIIAVQKKAGLTPKWDADAHIGLSVRVISETLGIAPKPEQKAALKKTLASHGIGGNASQFRQWLESEKIAKLPKGSTEKPSLDY